MEPTKNATNPEVKAEATETSKKIDKKVITTICICVAVIAVVVIGIILWHTNATKKANEAVGRADMEMNDSIALKLYTDAAELGTKSGNRAKLEAAVRLYGKGEYQKALDYLKDASVDSEVVEGLQYMLMGDCYVNLDKLDEGISCFEKAISKSDKNPQISPLALVKMANVYCAQQKYDKAEQCFEQVYTDYPEYWQTQRFDIKKYIERAKAQAGK